MTAGKSPLTAPVGVTPRTNVSAAKHRNAIFTLFAPPIQCHARSDRGDPRRANPEIRERGRRRRTVAKLRRAPPMEGSHTCTKSHISAAAASATPPAAHPRNPTLTTTVKRGSPALPPPRRPTEGERSSESPVERWIGREVSQNRLRYSDRGGETSRLVLNIPQL
jgi:hypothetical protein